MSLRKKEEKKKEKKKGVLESHVVSPHCAGKFILFYPSTRLAVATW